MKFSYSFLQEISPGIPSKAKFAEEFAIKSFEVDKIAGDIMDIKITANRWCDAASHEGIAKEAAAVFGLRAILSDSVDLKKIKAKLRLQTAKNSGCLRYIGVLAQINGKSVTPPWMKKRLAICGIRTINPIVDTLNYVMIETGQPMHAFDADKVDGHIIVRRAMQGETVETIDGNKYILESDDIVIADKNKILAIAGIKGGRAAEITNETKNIILESANFDPTSIYRTSQRIKLITDASQRYSHEMSSVKAERGMGRALSLLAKICSVKSLAIADEYKIKESQRFIKFDQDKLRNITGVDISKNQASIILTRLGFKVKGDIVYIPTERIDVKIFEDLAEEIIRIYGLNEIKAVAPTVSIVPIHNDPIITFREKVKRAFVSAGFDEIMSYSFGNYDETALKIANPINQDKERMRNNLIQGLREAIEKNKKIFDDIKIFEFGKIFESYNKEHWAVAAAVKMRGQECSLRILRGTISAVFRKIGISGEIFTPLNGALILKIEGDIIGKIFLSPSEDLVFFEANAEKLMRYSEGEFEYEAPSPYPAAMRDISLWAESKTTVGELLEIINSLNVENLNDVDLGDYYPDEKNARVGITLRLVFQSPNKTLTDAEIDAWMYKIKAVLEGHKGVVIR